MIYLIRTEFKRGDTKVGRKIRQEKGHYHSVRKDKDQEREREEPHIVVISLS